MDSLIAWLIVCAIAIAAYLWFRRGKKADLSMLPSQFVVADIETTGLKPDRHEIIEIAAVLVNRDSEHHQTWASLVKPAKKIPKKITEITGITQDMVDADGAPLEAAISEFLAFVGDHRLVFFNAEFDMAFLDRAALRLGRRITNPVSCALKMTRRAWPKLKSYKLASLARVCRYDTNGVHRALKDCELTIRVYAAAASQLRRAE